METKQSTSKTRMLFGVAAIAAVILIIAGAVYAVISANNTNKTANTSNTSEQIKSDKVVTQQSLNTAQNEVNDAVKQSTDDHNAAKAAVNYKSANLEAVK